MSFRDLAAEVDDAVEDELSDDDISINGLPVPAMYSEPWLAPDLGQQPTALTGPQIRVRDMHVRGLRVGVGVQVGEQAYRVYEIKPDGTGWTVLLLR
ncbi:hypothetical protein [Pandoraea sp. ISTKB]|uniref:head-tail joining protein n=1 Tax=Pandoraea sp. ISTKB TaxID=1586708 RepID=UPI0008467A2D|nr:hypothetical protein [Pandoraea sp. ISTKB]ODP33077.1 hypothetical protein A9762_20760 [Pandoraea sp. ISTKB]